MWVNLSREEADELHPTDACFRSASAILVRDSLPAGCVTDPQAAGVAVVD